MEHRAEELVQEARAEAERRISAAKDAIERDRAARIEAALAGAKRAREAAEDSSEAEYRKALESYKRLLEAAPVDEAAFREACERGLSGAI
ncbi:MAG TPA: hypothetical protein VFL04_02075 [Rectinemataceae bacterium]|nr:hypothetical protein [Rectinemataceae bacterium]